MSQGKSGSTQQEKSQQQRHDEEIKDVNDVYEEDADVKGVEPNFRIKNGDTVHQNFVRGSVE